MKQQKHQNTVYSFAQGGFGDINIDLVRDAVVKVSKDAKDTSIHNEIRMYNHIQSKCQVINTEHLLRVIEAVPQQNQIVLERADCDLRFYARITNDIMLPVVVAMQALEALLSIHQAGVVHCDIKPSNILIQFDAKGNYIIKICDLGLSHLVDDITQQQKPTIKGTSGYTDPRAILSKSALTPRSDIWSLAISLLLIATEYKHINDLETKTLRNLSKKQALTEIDIEQFINDVIQQIKPIAPEGVITDIIMKMINHKTNDTQQLLYDILEHITSNHPQTARYLSKVQFCDQEMLSTIPYIEYFKYIPDIDSIVYLTRRVLVFASGDHFVAVKQSGSNDCYIYYNSSEFLQKHTQLFKQYMKRFGFPSQMRTKTFAFCSISIQDSDDDVYLLQMTDGDSAYTCKLFIASGDQVIVKSNSSGIEYRSQMQNRFVVLTPPLTQ